MIMLRQIRIIVGMASLLTCAFASMPLPVVAVTSFHNCEQVCSGTCVLDGNVTCDTKAGITLTSSGDLDLMGYNITCTANCPQSAVTMSGSGNILKNTGGHSAGITGPFVYNVNCGNRANSRVSGLKIENTRQSGGGGYGLLNCETIDGNVIVGHLSAGYASGIGAVGRNSGNGTTIIDNYISNWATGIDVSDFSGYDVAVERNVVVIPDAATSSMPVYGLYIFGGGVGRSYTANTFMGGGATSASQAYTYVIFKDNNATGTFANNFCDPAFMCCQNCADCANSSAPPAAPILY